MMQLDWWLLAFWVVVLAGLVGGKVYQQHARWQRRCYLLVFVYLLALLAIVILPEIAPRREIVPEMRAAAEFALPLHFRADRAHPGRARARRAGADHRLLLQRVPDAAARRGDPGQLRPHDGAAHRRTWRRLPIPSS